MAKRKKLRVNKKQAKKNQNKLFNEISRNYMKAMKQLNELESRGFVFKESFKKNIYNKIVNMKKPNAKTRDYYKKMSYKKELYQQAKGFESEPNKIVSVKEGKKIVRERNKKYKKETKKETYRQLYEKVDQLSDTGMFKRNGVFYETSFTEEKNRLREAISDAEYQGFEYSEKDMSMIFDALDDIGYSSDEELIRTCYQRALAIINKGSALVVDDDIETIGTPWEEK